ncbi:MAG TPA: putative toxin-antitoxin system toxin component, PIN family [Thermomicrobiales bacterium]|nr:putative toxin-antitoxin system toxin component, PIN family [Thermomicrobiales bacterium]
MRASIDANVIVRFLLNPTLSMPPVKTLLAGMRNQYQLCLSEGLLREVNQSVRKKPYLSKHIDASLLDQVLDTVRLSAEVIPDTQDTPRSHVRDPKDDYLVAHALAARVDYLVTGDKDLLVLGQVGSVLIVTPAEFLAILNAGVGTEG